MIRTTATPFHLWLWARLIVPLLPIAIQYVLFAVGAGVKPGPQITYIVLLFSLSLTTITDYRQTLVIILLSVIPAIGATVLYAWAIFIQALIAQAPPFIAQAPPPGDKWEAVYNNILVIGFRVWLALLVINIALVLLDRDWLARIVAKLLQVMKR